jgi:3'(2'), 5'-bisphosphate nucleotidase
VHSRSHENNEKFAALLTTGGSVTMLDGAPFFYGKTGFRNPGFIARGL